MTVTAAGVVVKAGISDGDGGGDDGGGYGGGGGEVMAGGSVVERVKWGEGGEGACGGEAVGACTQSPNTRTRTRTA